VGRHDVLSHDGAAISRHLRDGIILTKGALKVAPSGGNGIGPRSGSDVEERLLFDGVHVGGADLVIYQRVQYAGNILANAADAGLVIFDRAAVSTELALDGTRIQPVI
jgi:hypothetical protein